MNNESLVTFRCITPRKRRASHVSSRSKVGILIVISFLVFWNDLAKGDEIHKAAEVGDVQRVAAILQANPNLVAARCATNEVDDAEYDTRDLGRRARPLCTSQHVMGMLRW